MAGARTADLNPINMGPDPAKYRRLRLKRRLAEYNLRVIVSGSGTVNPHAEVFKRRFSPIIILTTNRATKSRFRQLQAVADEVKVCGAKEIDFQEALCWLRKKWGVQRLLCEGGSELNDALFQSGLVNELHLTLCPKFFGGRSAPTICEGEGVVGLSNAAFLRLKSARRVGNELFLVYEVGRRQQGANRPVA